MKINPEIPQWLLDIFNKIDFEKVNSITKYTFITVIKSWCSKNLTLLQANKTYSSKETKRIAKDFDIELLAILNKYEFSNIPKKTEEEVKIILNSALQALPLK